MHGAGRRWRCDGRQAGDRLARQGRDGGSRCGRGKHPAPSTPSPCSRKAHGTGTGKGETGTPGRLAPQRPAAARLAPGGTSTDTSTDNSRGIPQGTPQVMSLPRLSRRVRLAGAAVPGRCGGAVRRALGRAGATRCWAVRRGPGSAGAAGPAGAGAAVQDGGAAAVAVRRGAVRRASRGAACRCDGRCGATGEAPGGAVRRAAREGDPPAWVFWLLANGREGHVPTPATNRLVAKPEKKYCGVCPMP